MIDFWTGYYKEIMNVSTAINSSADEGTVDVSDQESLIQSIVFLLIGPLVIAANSVILWAIKNYKSLHKVTYYLLADLAVSDILCGVVSILRFLAYFSDSKKLCVFSIFLTGLAYLGTLSGTLTISLHSCLAIKGHTRFLNGISVRVVKIIITVKWIVGIIISLATFVNGPGSNHEKDSCSIFGGYYTHGFLIVLATTCWTTVAAVIFTQAFTVIYVQCKKRALRSQAPQGNPSTANHLKKLKERSKVVTMITIIVVLNTVALLPVSIVGMLHIFCESCGISQGHVALSAVSCLLSLFGNIVVYFLKSREFKKVLRAMCNRHGVVQAAIAQPDIALVEIR